jgi:hypothetical protein
MKKLEFKVNALQNKEIPLQTSGISNGSVNAITAEPNVASPKKKDKRLRSHSEPKKKYKTELCRTHEETGICPYGPKCQFAHSLEELRSLDRHPRYKTEMCKTFWERGSCPYGKRCCFIHTFKDDEPTTTPLNNAPPLSDDTVAAEPVSSKGISLSRNRRGFPIVDTNNLEFLNQPASASVLEGPPGFREAGTRSATVGSFRDSPFGSYKDSFSASFMDNGTFGSYKNAFSSSFNESNPISFKRNLDPISTSFREPISMPLSASLKEYGPLSSSSRGPMSASFERQSFFPSSLKDSGELSASLRSSSTVMDLGLPNIRTDPLNYVRRDVLSASYADGYLDRMMDSDLRNSHSFHETAFDSRMGGVAPPGLKGARSFGSLERSQSRTVDTELYLNQYEQEFDEYVDKIVTSTLEMDIGSLHTSHSVPNSPMKWN